MSERAPGASEALNNILKIGASTMVIIFLIYVFVLFRTNVEGNFMERTAYQLSENHYSSDATVYRTVFNKDFLEDLSTDEELFVRKCGIGHFTEISSLESNDTWSFGYSPSEKVIITKFSRSFPASLFVQGKRDAKGYEDVELATLSLTLYDTYTTRLTCIVEKAFLSKEVQKMRLPCLFHGLILGRDKCQLEIIQQNSKLCLRDPSALESIDCRVSKYTFSTEINVLEYDAVQINDERLSEKILKAYPIKAGFFGTSVLCNTLKSDTTAVAQKSDDEVRVVKLCLEDSL
jgi:hypothetical protein